jgi:hypothetical protein
MPAVTVNTDAVAEALRSIRSGCATDHGRSAVDAASIAMGHQFSRQDRSGDFNHVAFLRACGAK